MGRYTRSILLTSAAVLVLSSLALKARDPNDGNRLPAVDPQRQAEEIQISNLIVKLKDAVVSEDPLSDEQVAALSRACGEQLTYVRPMSGGAHVLALSRTVSLNEAGVIVTRLEKNAKNVEYASPDAPAQPQLAPDDTHYPLQWHYHTPAGAGLPPQGLNLPPAWDSELGSPEVVVAVIDTGHRPHADLEARRVAGYDLIASSVVANDGGGRDADSADPGDGVAAGFCGVGAPARSSSWHGTHVAGTIGAITDNGTGVAGVNWASKIQHVRVLGRCGGTFADIVDGIRWAAGLSVPGVPINTTPARVLNMSLGGAAPDGKCPKATQAAINDAYKAGALVVVAAGNDASLAKNSTPANCTNVVTVHATARNGGYASYSNFGKVTLSAPGGETSPVAADGVLSTLNSGAGAPVADNYVYYQGTSMATPHVAGLASLIVSRRPSLTPAKVRDVMKKTARAFPTGLTNLCTKKDCGVGIVDAGAAIASVTEQAEPVFGCPAVEGGCASQNFPAGKIKADFSYLTPSGNSLSVTQSGGSFGMVDAYGHPHEDAGDHVVTCVYWDGALLLQARAPALDVSATGKAAWKHTMGKGHNSYTAIPNIDGVSSIRQTRGEDAKSKVVTVAGGANLRAKQALGTLGTSPVIDLTVQHRVKGGGACYQTTFPSSGVELEFNPPTNRFDLNAVAP